MTTNVGVARRGEPLQGVAHLGVTAQRCKGDFARQMHWLVDVGYRRLP